MFFQDPEKEIIFKNKCIIAEESNSKKKLVLIENKIRGINDYLDILNKKYLDEKHLEKKNNLEEQLILNIAELRTLTSYKKFLSAKLTLVKPHNNFKPTLAYLAKKAKEALIEMGVL